MLELVWIALASAATTMLVGMLWWGPLFGKPWMEAMGWTSMSEAELEAKRKQGGAGYMVSTVGAILGGLLLWLFFDSSWMNWTRFGKVGFGAIMGFLVVAGFYLPATAVTNFFESRSWVLWRIDAGYRIVTMTLWGVWVGVFHV